MSDWIGWLASAVFAGSYFSKNQNRLRIIQAAAAALWAVYGVILHTLPLIVANLVVVAVALWSTALNPRQAPAETAADSVPD